MNLLLLEPGEISADGTARLGGRRATHVLEVLRVAPGERIRVGVLGGRLGEAEVLSAARGALVLAPVLQDEPPPPSPVALLVAVPRPKILRRVLQAAASMGVKRILLLGTYRVEKSYFASPALAPEAVREELLLGLEQGRDTILPEVSLRRFFKPFVEDELDALFPEPCRLLAHPAASPPTATSSASAHPEPFDSAHPERSEAASAAERSRRAATAALPPTDASPPLDRLSCPGPRAALAIGPEGGFTAYEAGRLVEKGFLPFSLGPRVLRVDAAVPYAVGQAELWLRRRG